VDLLIQVLLMMCGVFYLGMKYGQHNAHKEFNRFIQILQKTTDIKLKDEQPDPFFTKE